MSEEVTFSNGGGFVVTFFSEQTRMWGYRLYREFQLNKRTWKSEMAKEVAGWKFRLQAEAAGFWDYVDTYMEGTPPAEWPCLPRPRQRYEGSKAA